MTDMAVEGRSASEHRGQLVNRLSLRGQKVHSHPCFGAVKYNSLGQISHALYEAGGECRGNM